MIGIAKVAVVPVRFPPTLISIQEPDAQDMRQDRVAVIAAHAASRINVRLTVSGMITSAIASIIIPLVVPAVAVSRSTRLARTPLSVVPALPAIPRRKDVCPRQHRLLPRRHAGPATVQILSPRHPTTATAMLTTAYGVLRDVRRINKLRADAAVHLTRQS